MMEQYHIPALLNQTIEGLNILEGGVYVDVTFGGGGHSDAILSHLNRNGKLYSFDQDIEAYENYIRTHVTLPQNWQFVHSNFRYIKNFMRYYGESNIDGLLADLGVSFHHFDTAQRGFSFRFSSPLDMRMNRDARLNAAEIINTYSEQDLAQVLYLYGEMSNSRQVARAICRAREKQAIERTEQLIEVVTGKRANKAEGTDELEIDTRSKKDLAKLFQALRIEVNDEMGALRELLLASKDLLKTNGRIAVLTYHSLEDRMVKNFFRTGNIEGKQEKDFYGNILSPFKLINQKVIVADEDEVERNPRARSAKLRIAEKI